MSDPSQDFQARHWYGRSALSWCLFPLSLLFGAVAALRRGAYRMGLLPSHKLPVPVIVVGNLSVGGTGKTPLALALVAALRGGGWQPGIVSRGYGGSARGPAAVPLDGDAAVYGDEPVLMAQRGGVPVFVGRRRADAARALLAAHPECNIIVCDDGLQHYALARNVEIAVRDSRGYGNGFLLPAGPLREPATRKVHATVINGGASLPAVGLYAMALQPAGFYFLHDGSSIERSALREKRLHAVAGIGHPERFFESLRAQSLDFVPHAFPDHHVYTDADLRFPDCDLIVMTEKDAVKCRAFCLDAGRVDLVAARIEARLDPALLELIGTRLHGSSAA